MRGHVKTDAFTRAYITCAVWSSTDESDEQGGEPLDKNYDASDLAPETLAKMIADCAAFQETNRKDLLPWSDEQAGHDFWLTRNRHGAGFWDRGKQYDANGNAERLTNASHVFGEVYLYVGDDGRIYQS